MVYGRYKNTTGVLVGHCPVDSGQILLIDPCYIKAGFEQPGSCDFDNPTTGYERVCAVTLNKGAGEAEGGVATRSGYGDGRYPVYADFNAEGRIVRVEILFDNQDEESDEDPWDDNGEESDD